MKFQVPQFVEVEDKIFWALTLKQFIYLAGGGGLVLMLYVLVHPFFLAVLLMIPVVAFSLALAFYKYNNRPFIFMVESATKFLLTSKLYIWKKVETPAQITPTIPTQTPQEQLQANTQASTSANFVPKLSNSKLKDLRWSLDAKK